MSGEKEHSESLFNFLCCVFERDVKKERNVFLGIYFHSWYNVEGFAVIYIRKSD